MPARRPTVLLRPLPALALGLICFSPASALAGSWGDNWGTMLWGPTPVPALTAAGNLMLGFLLALAMIVVMRSRRVATRLSRPLARGIAAALLLAPIAAYAGSLGVTNIFANGMVAEADEVNTNFADVETAVNDNDGRISVLETGIQGYEVSTGAVACAGAGGTVSINCSSGKRPIAGGCVGSQPIDLVGSAPSITGWTCSYQCNGSTANMEVTAVCAYVP